jgi:catechol 2,3-dioxygenase-like lactoylglutathione lyase family enzyme
VKLSQVRLLVDDFRGSFRFLRDALGLEPTFGNEDEDYASFSAGDGTIALFRRSGQAGVLDLRAPGDSALVVLEVDDVDADVARLGELVVEGPVDQPGWGGRVAYLRDPEGNLFELFQTITSAEE